MLTNYLLNYDTTSQRTIQLILVLCTCRMCCRIDPELLICCTERTINIHCRWLRANTRKHTCLCICNGTVHCQRFASAYRCKAQVLRQCDHHRFGLPAWSHIRVLEKAIERAAETGAEAGASASFSDHSCLKLLTIFGRSIFLGLKCTRERICVTNPTKAAHNHYFVYRAL